jgi:hypothetical protein
MKNLLLGLVLSATATAALAALGAGDAAPAFTTQPAGALACPTGSAAFTATATGAGVQYTWQIRTASGTWQSLGNDPAPMSCTGGGSGAFAYAAPPFSGSVTIGVRPCPGVTSYQLRVRATAPGGCGSATSNEATYTICAADYNCSNALSVNDIFDFLNGWFAGDVRADFNGGGLAVQDIFDYLAAWFVGC